MRWTVLPVRLGWRPVDYALGLRDELSFGASRSMQELNLNQGDFDGSTKRCRRGKAHGRCGRRGVDVQRRGAAGLCLVEPWLIGNHFKKTK